ncbi:histidine kinase [Granulicella sibirica]|uniref:histidine kinase n=1 Tax=Granulicella sibirica TaxID=2479048 RepID=A0A4Q0T2C6_9BACT|nr:histidine kinase [Granulicella sibirica]
MAYVDADLRYLAANQMYVERFGRPEQQIVGQLVSDVTGPAFENVARHLRAALTGEIQYLEPRMISVDGYRTLSVTHLPHRDADGTVLGVIVYGCDITEQRRAEAALLQSEKLAAVGRLASSIAHEINNPLESVVNLLYLIEQTVHQDAEQARQFALLAQQELARVSQIATQTLRFFKQSTSRQRVDIPGLMDSVLALYAGKLVNSNVEVVREYRDRVELVCLEGELRQALNNLVGNAIDVMRVGGRLRVRVRGATDFATGRTGVRLTVADTGVGMSSATQSRIFEPFFTTKGIMGTGLGLWITQELVVKENGRLGVRSREDQPEKPAGTTHGTVFALFLPDGAV